MSIRAKQLTRKGEPYLQEAILDVLYNAYPEGKVLGPAEICRQAGIYRKAGVAGMNAAIATGFLNQLHEQGKVERVPQENNRGGWRLTASEYARRRDGIGSVDGINEL